MKRPTDTRTSERLLEIRTVDVISGRGHSLTPSSVRCPIRSRTAAVEECADCGRSAGVAQDALARGPYLRLPVESDDGAVVGVITAMDVVAWLAGPDGPLAVADAGRGAQPG